MPTPTLQERIDRAQRLLARAQADIERAAEIMAEAYEVEPEYHELPPVTPAETPGEAAMREALRDPQFRAFLERRRKTTR